MNFVNALTNANRRHRRSMSRRHRVRPLPSLRLVSVEPMAVVSLEESLVPLR